MDQTVILRLITITAIRLRNLEPVVQDDSSRTNLESLVPRVPFTPIGLGYKSQSWIDKDAICQGFLII